MKTTLATIKKYWPAAGEGFNAKNPVFYGHGKFPNETPAHKIVGMRHTGWFTNEDGETWNDGSGLCVGTVFTLPPRPGFQNGVFLAGYIWGDNGERVIYPEIFASVEDCAKAADSHAESFAEMEREHNAKWNEARRLEDKRDKKQKRLLECLALRNRECMVYLRGEAREIVATIREINEKLAGEYANYV
jgi:hypothetical protein